MGLDTPSEHRLLDLSQVRSTVADALDHVGFDHKRVLLIVPDHTRTAPVEVMFRLIHEALAPRVTSLDVMIALGTHHPLTTEAIYKRMGITTEEHQTLFTKTQFFNHNWKDPAGLKVVGELSEDRVADLTGGRLRMTVQIPFNALALEYDHLLICGPVFPHEVVGFSGGNKYLFPGIAGQEILDFFHWLGALITNPGIIGHKYTAVRAVIDEAALCVPLPKSCFAMVVRGRGLAGLFYGTPEDAWSKAADLSSKLHIIYKDRPFHTVLSCAPEMYDDIWVAGKCMYKLEPVVADGGRLIIYAPHITEVSHTHGDILDEIGYHTRDYFVGQWDRFRHHPWGVLAHSTHVKGIGSFQNGVEKPRIEVILATGIPEEHCRKLNLGYLSPAGIDVGEYQGREAEGILHVPRAGETLYRLKGSHGGLQ